MSASVSALDLLRWSEKARPTAEKSRSTVADVAGQPRYCRAARDGGTTTDHCDTEGMTEEVAADNAPPVNGNGYVWVAENAGGRPGWVLWVE